MEQRPLQCRRVGVRKAHKLGHDSERLKGNVATDGSLLGKAGKWGVCGWAVVQLDCDDEMGPLLGMYGSVEADFEVQRTIKRAELTAFSCLSQESDCTQSGCTSINKGIINGLRRGESKCIKPRAERCRFMDQKFGEESHDLAERGILVEVEHVKAHHTKKGKK